MFLVELSFDDRPDRLELRPAHREKLSALHARGIVPLAGPYPDGSGAMLVFDVADEAEVDRILADDPYYSAAGVTIVRKQPWDTLPL